MDLVLQLYSGFRVFWSLAFQVFDVGFKCYDRGTNAENTKQKRGRLDYLPVFIQPDRSDFVHTRLPCTSAPLGMLGVLR